MQYAGSTLADGVLGNEMNRLSIRFLVVGALVLGMLIPLVFVGGVADERQRYYKQAVQAIAGSWGGDQTIIGPLLVVPVLEQTGAFAHQVVAVLI